MYNYFFSLKCILYYVIKQSITKNKNSNNKTVRRAAQHNAPCACSSAILAQSDLCFIDQPQTQSL